MLKQQIFTGRTGAMTCIDIWVYVFNSFWPCSKSRKSVYFLSFPTYFCFIWCLHPAMWYKLKWHKKTGGCRVPHHWGCGLCTQEGAAQHQGHQWGQSWQDSGKIQQVVAKLFVMGYKEKKTFIAINTLFSNHFKTCSKYQKSSLTVIISHFQLKWLRKQTSLSSPGTLLPLLFIQLNFSSWQDQFILLFLLQLPDSSWGALSTWLLTHYAP